MRICRLSAAGATRPLATTASRSTPTSGSPEPDPAALQTEIPTVTIRSGYIRPTILSTAPDSIYNYFYVYLPGHRGTDRAVHDRVHRTRGDIRAMWADSGRLYRSRPTPARVDDLGRDKAQVNLPLFKATVDMAGRTSIRISSRPSRPEQPAPPPAISFLLGEQNIARALRSGSRAITGLLPAVHRSALSLRLPDASGTIPPSRRARRTGRSGMRRPGRRFFPDSRQASPTGRAVPIPCS